MSRTGGTAVVVTCSRVGGNGKRGASLQLFHLWRIHAGILTPAPALHCISDHALTPIVPTCLISFCSIPITYHGTSLIQTVASAPSADVSVQDPQRTSCQKASAPIDDSAGFSSPKFWSNVPGDLQQPLFYLRYLYKMHKSQIIKLASQIAQQRMAT